MHCKAAQECPNDCGSLGKVTQLLMHPFASHQAAVQQGNNTCLTWQQAERWPASLCWVAWKRMISNMLEVENAGRVPLVGQKYSSNLMKACDRSQLSCQLQQLPQDRAHLHHGQSLPKAISRTDAKGYEGLCQLSLVNACGVLCKAVLRWQSCTFRSCGGNPGSCSVLLVSLHL